MTTLFPLDPGFTTPEMAEIWTAAARTGAILEFEAALASSLGEAGLAPVEEAEAVALACARPLQRPEEVLASTWESGTPLIAVMDELRDRLTAEQARWVHYGATTQDAIDTAQMLQAARGLDLLEASLTRIADSMMRLMEANRRQPQMGRTFLQLARPTTVGMRVALWLEPVLRHIEGLRAARSSLALQLGGPVGNRAELGPEADQVVRAVARRLGLDSPLVSWHADRSRMWRLVDAVEHPIRSTAKVAMDIALLAQSDVAELTVRGGGSSSMAGKQNPLDAIRALAAADACSAAAGMISRGRPHELDRGIGSWHVEWLALPLLFQTAAANVQALERLLGSVVVQPESMASRVPAQEEAVGESVEGQIDGVIDLYRRVVGR
jgi:3-carboxy-cis,cis-muconate cycloisomerase